MSDLIRRQDVIDNIREVYEYEFPTASGAFDEFVTIIIPNILQNLPAVPNWNGEVNMSDEEFLANIKNIDNEKLIQSLQSCGHDGYYNDLYYPIIEEIKRRLSLSPSTEIGRTAKVIEHDASVTDTNGYKYHRSEYLCGACKKRVLGGDDYCSHCGAKLIWGEDDE